MSTGGVKLGSSYDEARTRKVNAEAEIAELELAQVHGKLVVAEDVISAWADVLGAVKARLMSVASKAAPVVSSETNPGMCQQIIEDLVREALEELSGYAPQISPTTATVERPEEGDGGVETAPKTKRRRVGRPKKTAGLAKQ
jgi:hypothetical protein